MANNKPICQLPIELGHDIVTYCYLDYGHEGRCRPQPMPCQLCRATAEWYRNNMPDVNVFYRPTEPVCPTKTETTKTEEKYPAIPHPANLR